MVYRVGPLENKDQELVVFLRISPSLSVISVSASICQPFPVVLGPKIRKNLDVAFRIELGNEPSMFVPNSEIYKRGSNRKIRASSGSNMSAWAP